MAFNQKDEGEDEARGDTFQEVVEEGRESYFRFEKQFRGRGEACVGGIQSKGTEGFEVSLEERL